MDLMGEEANTSSAEENFDAHVHGEGAEACAEAPGAASAAASARVAETEAAQAHSGRTPGWLWRLWLSHALSCFGSRAWDFTMPLALLAVAPQWGLRAPAVYCLSRYGSNFVLGAAVGTACDRAPRLAAARAGAMAQGGAVIATAAAAAAHSADVLPLTAFVALSCLAGAGEVLGATAVGVAISKDWVPTLCAVDAHSTELQDLHADEERRGPGAGSSEQLLSRANAWMSRIDLSAETLAPLLAGAVLAAAPQDGKGAADVVFAVGLVNALSFVAEYALLARVHSENETALRRETEDATEQQGRESEREDEATSSGRVATATRPPNALRSFVAHPYGLQAVIMSYSLLYLTVLSPHGALLTAYLSSTGVSQPKLAAFRAAGAAAGVAGVALYGAGGRLANTGYASAALAICVAGAAAAFHAGDGFVDSTSGSAAIAFMVLLVVARVGLYNFELGCLEIQQRLADQTTRASLGSMESALCSLFTLVTYSAGLVKDVDFGMLVNTSATAVGMAAAIHLGWLLLWRDEEHTHDSFELGSMEDAEAASPLAIGEEGFADSEEVRSRSNAVQWDTLPTACLTRNCLPFRSDSSLAPWLPVDGIRTHHKTHRVVLPCQLPRRPRWPPRRVCRF